MKASGFWGAIAFDPCRVPLAQRNAPSAIHGLSKMSGLLKAEEEIVQWKS